MLRADTPFFGTTDAPKPTHGPDRRTRREDCCATVARGTTVQGAVRVFCMMRLTFGGSKLDRGVGRIDIALPTAMNAMSVRCMMVSRGVWIMSGVRFG